MLIFDSAVTYEISTNSTADTKKLATKLGKRLKGGDVIELASDLGGGKTTFVQGLARGLGYRGLVTSPTFTLSQIYRLNHGLELHHYDLYRLGESGAVGDELVEDLHDAQVITVIEWASIVRSNLPKDRLRIEFEVSGHNNRVLKITAGGDRSIQVLNQLRATGKEQL